MNRLFVTLGFVSFLLVGYGSAKGEIIGVAGGSGNPSATLGSYTMTSFAFDTGSIRTYTSSLDAPLSGSLDFSNPLYREPVSSLEAYWMGSYSNDYSGMVYFSSGTGGVTLTLPAATAAFYLYVVPDSYATPDTITVSAQDGTSVIQNAQSYITGAEYFGFYATGSDTITSLTISDSTGDNFLIGEFAIAPALVPEPSTILMVGLGLVSCVAIRRRQMHRRSPAKNLV